MVYFFDSKTRFSDRDITIDKIVPRKMLENLLEQSKLANAINKTPDFSLEEPGFKYDVSFLCLQVITCCKLPCFERKE